MKPCFSLKRLFIVFVLLGVVAFFGTETARHAWSGSDGPDGNGENWNSNIFTTTVAYVEEFYPLWFTYHQSLIAGSRNRLIGPSHISPLYHSVVAINDDTLYASTLLRLAHQATVLTIPETIATYSVLTLDGYGNVFDSGIPGRKAGTYVLTGPDFVGTLPSDAIHIAIPLNFSILIFRVDKFSSTNEDMTAEAETFRRSLKTQKLSDHLKDPSGGDATLILPEIAFALPFKTAADELISLAPIYFLKQLQSAVASSNTPPMSPTERMLSDRFDRLFGDGNVGRDSEFAAGVRAAHRWILDAYLTHLGPTNWIHFTNMGHWGDRVIDRSAISEFIQYGNGISTAAYYHAFKDGNGSPLNGDDPRGYVLTFPAGQIPQAGRFWSVTAYTPKAIELVSNSADKYVVASYTPGLQSNADGSISIRMAREQPETVPMANWLPVPKGDFNIMLRIYGVIPGGNIADNTYVPPGIVKNVPMKRGTKPK